MTSISDNELYLRINNGKNVGTKAIRYLNDTSNWSEGLCEVKLPNLLNRIEDDRHLSPEFIT